MLPAQQVFSSDALTRFDTQVRSLAAEHGVPGVGVALVSPEVTHIVCEGVTSITNPLTVTPETIFQIGSTTKTFTTLALALLEQEGTLSLHDRVQDHLPHFTLEDKDAAGMVTVLDLLTHQGGWMGDYFEDTGNGDDALERVVTNLAHQPQVVPPRTAWGYNNSGFYVAGRVLEVLTGQTFEAALTELVLEPLGMGDSLFFPNEIMTCREAAGHAGTGDHLKVLGQWQMMRSAAPAGSTLSCSTADMAQYARYLLTGEGVKEGTPLSRFNRQKLFSPHIDMGFMGGQQPLQMGLTWWLNRTPQGLKVQHGGNTMGHASAFFFYPEHGVAFVAHTNLQGGNPFHVELGKFLQTELMGWPEASPPGETHRMGNLAQYAGNYVLPTNAAETKATLTFAMTAEGLVLNPPTPEDEAEGSSRLRFFAPEVAVLEDGYWSGAGAEFLRAGDGKVFAVRVGIRIYRREP